MTAVTAAGEEGAAAVDHHWRGKETSAAQSAYGHMAGAATSALRDAVGFGSEPGWPWHGLVCSADPGQ